MAAMGQISELSKKLMNTIHAMSQIETLVPQHVDDRHWQAEFLHTVESDRAEGESLLHVMEQEAHKFINTHKLQSLLQWAAQVTDDAQEPFKPAAKRAEALAIALDRAIDLAHAHARDADRFLARECADNLIRAHTYACEIVRQLEHIENVEGRDERQSAELSPAFTDTVVDTWFNGLFDPKWVELSKEETQSLKNYLGANELVVRYNESAVGVSESSWDAIEQQMLLV
jgi:hypothetical protein